MPNTCHIIISGGSEADAFGEMTYLSVELARRLYPDATATVLTDTQTAESLEYEFETLKIIDIPAKFESNAQRSRYLKTSMRQLVDGDFVFLDSDALPLQNFDETATHGAPFAAALDRNREFPEPAFPEWVLPSYDELGWQYPLENYFNSGVVFMADTPAMRQFSEQWHKNWREMLDRCGVHQDQPSLNHTLAKLGTETHQLPLACNAMVDASPYFSRGAKIVHYFLRGEDRTPDPVSLLAHLIDHLRTTGEVDWQMVEQAAATSNAWVHPTGSVHIELATRHYFRAARLAASRIILRS